VTLLALGSAKASPGVTTTALALGAVWPDGPRVTIAEVDPAGGDLAAWLGLLPEPGLVSLAAAARHEASAHGAAASALLDAHTQRTSGGVRVLLGPSAASQAVSALTLLRGGLLGEVAEERDLLVLADCGRLSPASPALPVVERASMVLLVTRPVAAELGHAAAMAAELRRTQPAVGLILVGRGPYRAEEISATLGWDVFGELPEDRRASAALAGGGARESALRRTPLVRAARGLSAVICSRLAGVPSPSPADARSAPPVPVFDASEVRS
jgi:hypothetical protein